MESLAKAVVAGVVDDVHVLLSALLQIHHKINHKQSNESMEMKIRREKGKKRTVVTEMSASFSF